VSGGVAAWGRLVAFRHSIFALPFALQGAWLAANGVPAWTSLAWIVVCAVAARTAAMGFNRWLDRRIDARNPRTKGRELPAGVLSASAVLALVVLAVVAMLFKELAAIAFDEMHARVLGLPVRRLDLVLLALLVASVVAGMQVAGIVLVVAMIVAPAATARLLPGSLTTVIALAASIGAGCAVCGVLLSLRYESLPTGSAMTLCAGALFMLTTLVLAGRRWRGATPSTPADAAGRAGA